MGCSSRKSVKQQLVRSLNAKKVASTWLIMIRDDGYYSDKKAIRFRQITAISWPVVTITAALIERPFFGDCRCSFELFWKSERMMVAVQRRDLRTFVELC